MKSILITGGLGYVGGRVADHLARTRPDTRIHLTTSRAGHARPSWAEGFSVVEMDLERRESIARCFDASKFDAVVHLAALNEIDSAADPLRAYRVNALGTYHLAEAAKASGVRDILYFSTFHVYGTTEPGAAITENTPTFPSHPYATTHRAAEDMLAYFRKHHGLRTCVFRLTNEFGYPMHADVNRWTLVVNDLCRQAVEQGRMVLKTAGRQHRDFIALADVARAVELMLYEKRGEWGDGIFNVGGGSSMSVLEMAHRVADCHARVFGARPQIVVGEGGGDDGPVHVSIEKIKALGFKPGADIDAEISRTLLLCRAQAAASPAASNLPEV